MTKVQTGSDTSCSDGTAAAMAGPGTAGTKDPKQIMEAVLVKMLAVYEQLANATVLLSAPQVRLHVLLSECEQKHRLDNEKQHSTWY